MFTHPSILGASLVAQTVKNLPALWKTWFWSLGQEDTLKEGMATHSSILAWRIPWTEEPGGLQFMDLQIVRYDWANFTPLLHNLSISNPLMKDRLWMWDEKREVIWQAKSSKLSCENWELTDLHLVEGKHSHTNALCVNGEISESGLEVYFSNKRPKRWKKKGFIRLKKYSCSLKRWVRVKNSLCASVRDRQCG